MLRCQTGVEHQEAVAHVDNPHVLLHLARHFRAGDEAVLVCRPREQAAVCAADLDVETCGAERRAGRAKAAFVDPEIAKFCEPGLQCERGGRAGDPLCQRGQALGIVDRAGSESATGRRVELVVEGAGLVVVLASSGGKQQAPRNDGISGVGGEVDAQRGDGAGVELGGSGVGGDGKTTGCCRAGERGWVGGQRPVGHDVANAVRCVASPGIGSAVCNCERAVSGCVVDRSAGAADQVAVAIIRKEDVAGNAASCADGHSDLHAARLEVATAERGDRHDLTVDRPGDDGRAERIGCHGLVAPLHHGIGRGQCGGGEGVLAREVIDGSGAAAGEVAVAVVGDGQAGAPGRGEATWNDGVIDRGCR